MSHPAYLPHPTHQAGPGASHISLAQVCRVYTFTNTAGTTASGTLTSSLSVRQAMDVQQVEVTLSMSHPLLGVTKVSG